MASEDHDRQAKESASNQEFEQAYFGNVTKEEAAKEMVRAANHIDSLLPKGALDKGDPKALQKALFASAENLIQEHSEMAREDWHSYKAAAESLLQENQLFKDLLLGNLKQGFKGKARAPGLLQKLLSFGSEDVSDEAKKCITSFWNTYLEDHVEAPPEVSKAMEALKSELPMSDLEQLSKTVAEQEEEAHEYEMKEDQQRIKIRKLQNENRSLRLALTEQGQDADVAGLAQQAKQLDVTNVDPTTGHLTPVMSPNVRPPKRKQRSPPRGQLVLDEPTKKRLTEDREQINVVHFRHGAYSERQVTVNGYIATFNTPTMVGKAREVTIEDWHTCACDFEKTSEDKKGEWIRTWNAKGLQPYEDEKPQYPEIKHNGEIPTQDEFRAYFRHLHEMQKQTREPKMLNTRERFRIIKETRVDLGIAEISEKGDRVQYSYWTQKNRTREDQKRGRCRIPDGQSPAQKLIWVWLTFGHQPRGCVNLWN